MSHGHHEPERTSSSSSTNAVLIVLAVLGALVAVAVIGALIIVVCLAAITTIGSRANVTFQTVGTSLSAGGTPSLTNVEREVDEVQIRRVLDNQVQAWNKGDLEGFMNGYWRSPDLTFYSEDRPRRGWDETYKRYKERYQDGGKEMGQLSFSNLKIDWLGSGQALVRGEWKLVLKNGERSGLFTLILKEFPDGWRITHDHTSGPRETNP